MLFKRTKRIPDPVLGVLDLGTDSVTDLVTADLGVWTGLFSRTRHGVEPPPVCDVLLAYCTITAVGRIEGSQRSFREIVRDSTASVVVIAREHDVKSYIAGAPILPFGRTNLIMTLKRNDPAFRTFIAKLFIEMKKGTPLPAAWGQVQPQSGTAPELIFSNEIGAVAFA